MPSDEIPIAVRALIHKHIRSIDHAEAALELAEHPRRGHTIGTLAGRFRWTGDLTERVLDDLVASGLAVADDDGYRFAAQSADAALIGDLSSLYHKHPVTLVRTIYSAPLPVMPLVRGSSDDASASGS